MSKGIEYLDQAFSVISVEIPLAKLAFGIQYPINLYH